VRTLLALIRLGRPPLWRLALAVVLGAATVLSGAGLLASAGYLVSRSGERPPILSLGVAIAMVRVFGLVRPVARYFERLVSHDLAFRVLARMRVGFYRRLEALVPGALGEHRRGDLLASVVGDIDAMQDLFLRALTPPLVALIAGAVAVGFTASFAPVAAAVLAAGLIAGGMAVPAIAALAGRQLRDRRASLRAALTAELVELLRGAPELLVLGADDAALGRVGALDAQLGQALRRDALVSGVVEGLAVLTAGLTTAGVLAACVSDSSAGALDRVFVAALAFLALASFEGVQPLPAAALRLRSIAEAGRRILAVSGRRPAVADPADALPAPPGNDVALERVSFGYDSAESWGLHDLDLRLTPGRRVALVGPSGAGKSTLAGLLVRFLDPDSGSVKLGGADLRALRQSDVRDRVTLDAQEGYLFSTSILENVRLARPDADDEAIADALRRARLWEWVERLPEGWHTPVGEEGDRVSGGERRRIALARSLLAGAPVLVLDEPTAHLDMKTATALIGDALTASGERSVLLITHRSEGLDQVDEVLTLRRGRLAARERGNERPPAREPGNERPSAREPGGDERPDAGAV